MSIADALSSKATTASSLLGAMAKAHRLMVLCALLDGEKSVGALASRVSLSQGALSQHLAKIRSLGLVQTRREGQTIYYRLAGREVQAVLDTLHRLYCVSDTGEALSAAPTLPQSKLKGKSP